jgi:hypothetical protein
MSRRKQIKYVIMVPIEITLDSATQLKTAVRSIKEQGPFPSVDSYGEECYSWRVRCDKARLKNAVLP